MALVETLSDLNYKRLAPSYRLVRVNKVMCQRGLTADRFERLIINENS